MLASPLAKVVDRPRNALAEAIASFAPIATAGCEVVMFAYLDPEWRILGVRRMPSAARDTATVDLRRVISDALAFEAAAVAMAHNHPSGDPTPSAADHALTRRLARALATVEVRLVEHIVLAAHASVSFREQGWL